MKNPIQLTFGPYGHTLHHNQVISPDNQWVVYDTRNEDTQIGITTRIERVNIITKAIEVLYEVSEANQFGPGVGAATFSPIDNKVIFIHGIHNASKDKPYAMARRSGVVIDVNYPNQPINMDARNIYAPFTKGALKGGTHSHAWNFDGSMISFTYNDFVLEQNKISDERTVGVMFQKPVKVKTDELGECFSGKMFSVIISEIVDKAKFGSDEIEKAFDECWLGNKDSIVFQAWVRDREGNRKTEIYKVNLPKDLTVSRANLPIEGTDVLRPQVPFGVVQQRITNSINGISSFRHWLRSSLDGMVVYFLMEDEHLITNLYQVNVSNGFIKQLTFHTTSIHSPFNISPNGKQFVYFCNHCLYLFDIEKNEINQLLPRDVDLYGIPNFDKTGKIIFFNKYVLSPENLKYLQIFKLEL